MGVIAGEVLRLPGSLENSRFSAFSDGNQAYSQTQEDVLLLRSPWE